MRRHDDEEVLDAGIGQRDRVRLRGTDRRQQ
jgi:hypothetical protein